MKLKDQLAEILDEPVLTKVMEIINQPLPQKEELLLISQYSDKILFLVEHKEEMTNTDIQGAAENIVRMVLIDAKR
jgi:hypothetical protein